MAAQFERLKKSTEQSVAKRESSKWSDCVDACLDGAHGGGCLGGLHPAGPWTFGAGQMGTRAPDRADDWRTLRVRVLDGGTFLLAGAQRLADLVLQLFRYGLGLALLHLPGGGQRF